MWIGLEKTNKQTNKETYTLGRKDRAAIKTETNGKMTSWAHFQKDTERRSSAKKI